MPRARVGLIVVSALLLGPAVRTQNPVPLAERFRQFDRNGDGKVSAQEFPDPQFARIDANSDGFVTLEEAQAFVARRRAERPAQLRSQLGSITPSAHKEEIAEQRPGESPLKRMPDGDPARDAARHPGCPTSHWPTWTTTA